MRTAVVLSFALGLLALASSAQQPDYASMKEQAEKYYSEGSFAKARELYQKIDPANLATNDARWVAFRLADTLWRSQAATETADNTLLENARHDLDVQVRDLTRADQHDLIWAEVQESLGDYFWTRRNSQNWGQAWQYYQVALDWWAGSKDIDLARERYLRIVWTVARPPNITGYYYYGYYGNMLPLEIVENALKISKTPNDQARAHYLIAMTLRNQGGDWEQRERVPEEFEGAIKLGKSTDWYDDALYNYAVWMASQGRAIVAKDGGWRQEPDYAKALQLFRRLVEEFKPGESRYVEQAKQQIEDITQPRVQVGVANIFLPDSEIQYNLTWRNVKRIELALYKVDLTTEVRFTNGDLGTGQWLDTIDLSRSEKVKSWSRDTNDDGTHKPGSETVRLDGKIATGAYIIEAKAGGISTRDLLLVSDASIVLKASGRQALVYVCNVLNGAPIKDASVRLWERYQENNTWHWRESAAKTNPDGIALIDLIAIAGNEEILVTAHNGSQQSFSFGSSYDYGHRRGQDTWKIYAVTDRPAYRPGEKVQWKFLARRYNGSVYSTPSDQSIYYEITDPRGAKVKEDKITLNTFGSAWGSFEVTSTMPLGEYHVTFREHNSSQTIGSATLFRLEEYKLPEFKVSVKTPEEDGRPKAFRLGEKVEVNVQADYYFGGPVANANVEIVVYQNPFYHLWHRPHDFPWYYEDMSQNYAYRNWGGNGQVVRRETVKTDATGKAALTFDTPANAGQDFEYRIEARVTDASRREIVGNGNVRVTRQRYFVYAEPSHYVHRPQDKVSVEFKALDANEQPVVTEGTVRVTRDQWNEIWLDPGGREIKGEELKRIQRQSMIFPPPPPNPDAIPWRLKFRGYEHDEILTRTLKTDTNGAAELVFTPEREGYYRIAWTSEDKGVKPGQPSSPIQAETTVWVATGSASELGYHQGGLEIIVDKDTFRVGEKAPVLLSVPTNDRYVLFTVEGQDLYSYQLVHVTGTVKMVELPIEEKHAPNIFLGAAMVMDRQMFVDTKQIVVPPVKNFLTVDVQPDRAQHQPREEGSFTITTLNSDHKPVPAEVSFGLVDESVYYIQSDYAGDPRQFYFGEKRAQEIQTQGTFNYKAFAKLVEGENKQLLDERDQQMMQRRRDGRFGGGGGANRYYFAGNGMVDELSLSFDKDANGPMGGVAKYKAEAASSRMLGRTSLSTAAVPAAAAPMMKLADSAMREEPAPGAPPAVEVRSDFRATIVWIPDVKTGADGKTTVQVKYPDSLTSWKGTARAVTEANQFGIAEVTTRTKQPLIVRLQAPRFFLVGDKPTISAVINNNTESSLAVTCALNLNGAPGLQVVSAGQDRTGTFTALTNIPAGGEVRVDWPIDVLKPGEAKVRVTATAGKYGDAMEINYPTFEHGIEKFISNSGKVRGNDVLVKLDLPRERKPGSTTMTIQVTPSMAVTMLDALPYLINYPYGCTEQTMSRFLPTVITAKTLRDLGLKPEDAMARVFGGIEPTSAAATHPGGRKPMEQIDEMTQAALQRLYDFQHGDGGWGWWKEGGSDHFMTAYVVWGLTLAHDAGVNIKSDALNRGVGYLEKSLVEEEENYDMQAWMLHALAVHRSSYKQGNAGQFETKAFDNLWANREKLNAYTRALAALSAHHYGQAVRAKILIENLENGVKMDNSPDASVLIGTTGSQNPSVMGTAHWGEDGIYWRWSDGGVEATAFALRALLAIDPTNKLVEPVSNWLIKNRRGAQWNNTRDTAITVLAMNDYLRANGEIAPDIEYEVAVNGQTIATNKVTGVEVLNAPSKFAVNSELIRDGVNEVRITRHGGSGALYFAAQAQYFSLEEPIPAAGSEMFVHRQYYRLANHPTLLKGFVAEREPLGDNDEVVSGERVEVVLTIETKNNYEYLLFEDLKPAGLEAVQVRSGESLQAYELKSGAVDRKFGSASNDAATPATPPNAKAAPAARNVAGARERFVPRRPAPVVDEDHTGRARQVYQELRDRKVALFIDKLPQGVWEIKYEMRAEVPGSFHALPVMGQAMYVPEIRCNGSEIRLQVADAKP